MDRTECSLENLDYWIAQAMDARQEARDLTARLERATNFCGRRTGPLTIIGLDLSSLRLQRSWPGERRSGLPSRCPGGRRMYRRTLYHLHTFVRNLGRAHRLPRRPIHVLVDSLVAIVRRADLD